MGMETRRGDDGVEAGKMYCSSSSMPMAARGTTPWKECHEVGFRIICQTHARHGTTSICPTTTVATHVEQHCFLAGLPEAEAARHGRGPHPLCSIAMAHTLHRRPAVPIPPLG